MKKSYRYTKRIVRNWLEKTNPGYRYLLMRNNHLKVPNGYPSAPWANAVLKTNSEVDNAIEQLKSLGLPIMNDRPKNWDSLAALDLLLRETNKNAKIFDAGGELYSKILPWLFLYGYKNLIAGNLVFNKSIKKGPIIYQYNDITKTKFEDQTFDAVTCLSVIEHGIDLFSYFEEMYRILKPGGILITSTDYYDTKIDTKNQSAYGVPIHVFTKDEITNALKIAGQFGLKMKEPFDLSCGEKVVNWKRFDIKFSCVIFSLYKTR